MLEPRVGAQGAEEGLLEGVLGRSAPEHPGEVAVDLAAVGVVELFERRYPHGLHHPVKRDCAQNCEMRIAVVGHVEWVEFARVVRVPRAGEIVRATETWSEAAGGGAVAAAQIARLAGGADFFTALGEDELGDRALAQLEAQGITVHAQRRGETRRAFTFIDSSGERTITVLGEKLGPLGPLELRADAAVFVAGDAAALASARTARLLVAAARELATLQGTYVDVLVGSAADPAEQGALDPAPGLVIRTDGARGGRAGERSFPAAPVPGPVGDAYGCGDSFMGALAFALARGDPPEDALGLAARAGAAVLTGRGPYPGQIALA